MKRLLLLLTLIIPFALSPFATAEKSAETAPTTENEEASLSDWENFFDDSLQ